MSLGRKRVKGKDRWQRETDHHLYGKVDRRRFEAAVLTFSIAYS
jgi:hypothetical protein